MVNGALASWPGDVPVSLTVMVKLNVPLVVGVPEISPVEAFSVNPAGSSLALTDHVVGSCPAVRRSRAR